jgi:hypothetical protein
VRRAPAALDAGAEARDRGGELQPGADADRGRAQAGISPGQLYMWRHELPGPQAAVVSRAMPRFAEVALTTPSPAASPAPASTPQASRTAGRIEIVLPSNVIVRIDTAVDGAALGRVLDVLRRR